MEEVGTDVAANSAAPTRKGNAALRPSQGPEKLCGHETSYPRCGTVAQEARCPGARTEHTSPAADTPLAARERQIARLVRRGKANREIASTLEISARTVDQHVASIMRRQNVDRRWQIGGALLGWWSLP